jgi:hypothetical protein
MKYHRILFFAIIGSILINSCNTLERSSLLTVYHDSISTFPSTNIEITLLNGKTFNHPTYVIWQEDMKGNYVKTLFITKSYASGIFENKMLGDSIWINEQGSSHQPSALPYWTHKKGLINKTQLIPSLEYPFVDAYSGATPKTNFKFIASVKNTKNQYRLLLEVNQAWDWNTYWTNEKFEESNSYKHSAQPSLIYAVTVNQQDSIFHLNPIGHGDPKGESGKLFTDLATLSTANHIFNTLQIKINE